MNNLKEINRLNSAVKFLEDDLPFRVSEFWLIPLSPNEVAVNFKSNYSSIENITRQIAADELISLKHKFNLLKPKATTFFKYTVDKMIEYRLYIDYGMGSTLICLERNGDYKFFI